MFRGGNFLTWTVARTYNTVWRKNTNKMQKYRCLLSIQMFNIDYCLDMFRASLCPSSGEKGHVLLHMGLFAGSVGCGWLRYYGATLRV